MRNMLKYKSHVGSVSFSAADEVYYGRLEGIKDLVTFEGETVAKLKKSFKEAVQDYIELCKQKSVASKR